MTRVGDVVGWLEAAYPPALAEEWDRVGLSVGDPDAEVSGVLFAVDVTDAVADEAVERGAQLIVSHHPLLLRGIHAVRADEPKGRVLMRLIRAGVAVFSAHTNADAGTAGVADALADAVGLVERRPMLPAEGAGLDKLAVFVPTGDADAVQDALFAAGAGRVGDYAECSFRSEGTGQFRPLAGAHPTLGTVGAVERVEEVRLEVVLPRARRSAVLAALLAAHPYETPAFDLIELVPAASGLGLGRVGRLPQPVTAAALAQRLARAVPATAGGVRLGGDPDREISTVAVLGGAGDSLLDAARRLGVDCYVTGDLRHHPSQDFLAHDGAPALIDVPHYAAEWLWLPHAEELVRRRASAEGVELATHVSTLVTDPWVAAFR
ncbi:Nif3-like dinuclear metal center hexameric protein [Propioniciclava coleopterorum]|uniref:GTP cyclohydrolase 1 type 2 homolog n=1 Tax=Propioniciclava coleopterorum TaxID=2714937 RepID=A0A6G7Y2Y7_9ACTN|nr:Nif3-like dinuclear metal center hexameric protein [Propioniciclava coleopterorum]QIK71172.1 Nif3-like dinuclear metal center hexameric protein [Propioniciclava coleopterorum]